MVLGKWKMKLRVKNFGVDISTTLRQNSLRDPYHHPQGRDRLLIPSS